MYTFAPPTPTPPLTILANARNPEWNVDIPLGSAFESKKELYNVLSKSEYNK